MTAPPRKAEAAVALRLAGAQYDEIAQALNYPNERAAMAAAEAVLAAAATAEDKAKMRTVASMRYERLIRAIWQKAINPDDPEQMSAVRAARELIERHVSLMGLAVPQELVVRTPTQAELEAWVAQVSQYSLPVVEEADIVDVDVLEIESS